MWLLAWKERKKKNKTKEKYFDLGKTVSQLSHNEEHNGITKNM